MLQAPAPATLSLKILQAPLLQRRSAHVTSLQKPFQPLLALC